MIRVEKTKVIDCMVKNQDIGFIFVLTDNDTKIAEVKFFAENGGEAYTYCKTNGKKIACKFLHDVGAYGYDDEYSLFKEADAEMLLNKVDLDIVELV